MSTYATRGAWGRLPAGVVATLTPVVGGWELDGDGIRPQLILHDSADDAMDEATSVIVTATGAGVTWQQCGDAWHAVESGAP